MMNGGKGWGGIESHCVTLTLNLLKKGHRVIIGCPFQGQVREHAEKLGLPMANITVVNSVDIFAVWEIRRMVLEKKIQVVIANLGKEYWPAAVAAKWSGVKVVFVRHQLDYLKKVTVWLIANQVDRVVADSGAVKEKLIASGVSPEKIETIHIGIELDKFNPNTVDRAEARKEWGIGENELVIGNAGKLDPGKGVLDLLNAMEKVIGKYPHARLLFVGEGPCRDELEKRAEILKIKEKIIFAGLRKDMVKMYATMDIFVLPSYREGLPMSVMEAMSMEKPVIATTVGGIPELIHSEKNGLLVPPRDGGKLVEAIFRYVEDRKFAKKTAAEGRKTIETDFSGQAMGDKFERMLKGIGIG